MIYFAAGLLAYFLGSVPFGYLIGRVRGVDLFTVGSKNIGATNAFRELGWFWGTLVFLLDFAKGAFPVASAAIVIRTSTDAAFDELLVKIACAAAAFLGHLFPVFLKFRGGKGVATGAGAIAVLVPLPAAIALGTWVLAVLATRMISAGSIAAVVALAVAQVIFLRDPFSWDSCPASLFCFAGAIVVIAKHRANIGRIRNRTEPRVGGERYLNFVNRALHFLAVGYWFGSGTFFIFVATPPIFDSMKDVVMKAPSDRTANVRIVPEGTEETKRDRLASSLAGAAVAPIFPRFFLLSAICAWIAIWTSFGWRLRRMDRVRCGLAVVAGIGVAFGWPISEYVGDLRMLRYSTDPEVAANAVRAFGPWHGTSLVVSMVINVLTGAILILAVTLPTEEVR